jgi:tryptophanyl-tRNA synthetase
MRARRAGTQWRGRGNDLSGAEQTKKRRVLSGMRPTGRLHIGNYFGALANWVKLQNDPANECFFFVADWHSLTSDYADTSQIAQNTIEVMTDFLAAGLDPKKSVIFLQSSVPEHAELHLLLSMITPLGWLERVPTYKEQIENMKGKDLHTYGFLGYPVLQAADIVMYGEPGKSLAVPVGEDQVAHVELNREIVQSFNFHYGFEIDPKFLAPENYDLRASVWEEFEEVPYVHAMFELQISRDKFELDESALSREIRRIAREIGLNNFKARLGESGGFFQVRDVLQRPEVMLTEAKRVPGTDGRKMSKSYGNAIELGESDESIRTKTKVMMTDPARKRRTDKGNPDVCPVYDWHKLFSPPEVLKWSAEGCRSAGIGCIECKSAMADHLIKWIAPIRERRAEYGAHPDRVLQLLDEGSKRAQVTASATMKRVREAVFGWDGKRSSISLAGSAATKKHSGAGD